MIDGGGYTVEARNGVCLLRAYLLNLLRNLWERANAAAVSCGLKFALDTSHNGVCIIVTSMCPPWQGTCTSSPLSLFPAER